MNLAFRINMVKNFRLLHLFDLFDRLSKDSKDLISLLIVGAELFEEERFVPIAQPEIVIVFCDSVNFLASFGLVLPLDTALKCETMKWFGRPVHAFQKVLIFILNGHFLDD